MSLAVASSAAAAGFYSRSQTPTMKPQHRETAAGAAASRLVSTRCDEKQDPEEEDGDDGAPSESTRTQVQEDDPCKPGRKHRKNSKCEIMKFCFQNFSEKDFSWTFLFSVEV